MGRAKSAFLSFLLSFFLFLSFFSFFIYFLLSFFFSFFFLMQFFFSFLVLFVLHVCLLVFFFFFSLFVLLGVSKSPQIRCTCTECESVFYVAQWFELCFLVLTLNTPPRHTCVCAHLFAICFSHVRAYVHECVRVDK